MKLYCGLYINHKLYTNILFTAGVWNFTYVYSIRQKMSTTYRSCEERTREIRELTRGIP